MVSLAQFRQLTGEERWPDYLAPWLGGDALDYFCNGRVDYRVRGICVRLEVRWDWQAEQGDDTHQALYRGTQCRLEIRQGPKEGYRPELYVVPPDGMPLGRIGGAHPVGAEPVELGNARPAEPRLVAAARETGVDGGRHHVRGDPVGGHQVPAAAGRRVFLAAPGNDGRPVLGLQIYRGPDLLQELLGDQRGPVRPS